MDSYRQFVGVDISAEQLHIGQSHQRSLEVSVFSQPYTPEGMAALSDGLLAEEAEPGQTLVVMEATGNFWMRLAYHLDRQGFAVSVINPAQAHYFAQAVLQRGKSDVLDAQMLTRLAATLQPARWTPPPPLYEELRQRLTERDTLLDIRQQVRNQSYALTYNPHPVPAVEQRRQAQLTLLDQQVTQIEAEIEQLLGQPGPWAASAQRLLSIPGIGLLTAAWLLVATVNFSQAQTVEQITAYAGLAPRPRQSGTSLHGRTSIGHTGHARLRSALYMAVLSAIRFNPPIRAYYYRLLERGKVKKVALCAAARKLLHLAWTLVKKERFFDPNFQPIAA